MALVNPREKWPNEAWDFTPWLAKNLGLLGKAVGLKLETVQQEQQVGSFSLDILAREAGGGTVAIENQLEWSDHSHLGQLLTYAAGCDARIAIWVAAEFQHEHAAALHALNQWAGERISFYGVKVEVVKEADGCLRPRLRTVVSPGEWNKDLTLSQPPPPNPEIERCKHFFGPLIARVPAADFPPPPRQVYSFYDRFYSSGFDRDIGYGVSLSGGPSVFFHIRTWESVDLSNSLFDALEAQRQDIESSIGAQGEWYWSRYNSFSMVDIGVNWPGVLDDSPEQSDAARAWMLALLPRFKCAFEERTARLLAELRQPENTQSTGE